MRLVHGRLREALGVARESVRGGVDVESAAHDLKLFCHGFCSALTRHHEGEDRLLFPAIARAYPELEETLRYLEQDHSMIGYLLDGLQAAVESRASPEELERHLDGISAIMESHFRYEERQLLTVLETLDLQANPHDVYGPL